MRFCFCDDTKGVWAFGRSSLVVGGEGKGARTRSCGEMGLRMGMFGLLGWDGL